MPMIIVQTFSSCRLENVRGMKLTKTFSKRRLENVGVDSVIVVMANTGRICYTTGALK